MPVTPLKRTSLDKAKGLLTKFLAHQQALSGQIEQGAEEISGERQEKVLALSAAYEARKQAVASRDARQKRIEELPKDIADMEFQLVYALNRRSAFVRENAALERQRFDAKETYDETKLKMAAVDAEIELAMGAALDHAPKTSDPTVTLDPAIQEWAEKFGTLSKTETVAFFKASSEKAGAQIDLRKIDAEIANCEIERRGIERQIPLLEDEIAGLKSALLTAQNQQGAREDAVLVHQGTIDQIKTDLADLAHKSGLHEMLSVEAIAVDIALIEAHDEARDNLLSLKAALAALDASNLSTKDRKVFKPYLDKRAELVAVLRGIDRTASLFDKVPEFETIYDDGTDLAGSIDGYLVSSIFQDAAQRSRERLLQDPIKDQILKDVLEKNNASAPSDEHKVDSIGVDHSVLVAASKIGDKASLVVSDAQMDHVREAAQKDYDAKAQIIVERLLAAAAKVAEIQRHKDLDLTAADELYADLNATERRSELQRFKNMAPDDGTVVGLRAALRQALKLQGCPDPELWRRILGLSGNPDVRSAKQLNACDGETYPSHATFYADCLGAAAKNKISLTDKNDAKPKAGDIIDKLFGTGNKLGRAHSTLEVFGYDSKENPHAYYKSNGSHHLTKIPEAFASVVDGEDEGWIKEVGDHIREQLDDKIADLHAKVQHWLDTDGKR